ncbi:unnamed protein product [Rhizoctonia solani]|uniref:UBA domain-containing protein n=1 Tax=Rhizoctonia solani TaxID=456999 RepID=A0A8H3DI51_9AGAM|nr:unnamed protein product [Rhizoctonia solani]
MRDFSINQGERNMASIRDTLIYMGFAPERVDWALKDIRGASIDQAMDHIEANIITPVPDLASTNALPAQGKQDNGIHPTRLWVGAHY